MSEVRENNAWTRFGSIILHAGVAALAIAFLFPFFWMISNAIRPNGEVLATPPRLLPSEYDWGNFAVAWFHLPFGQFFINSTIVAGCVTLITLVVSSLGGYAFARMHFPGRDALFSIYLGTLMVPQAVIVIPLFLMMSRLGWVNTFQGLILPVAFSSFGTFLMRQFFLSIPKELEEAAMIDGASRLRILVSIFLPLALPAIGLLALFTFTGQWNSFLWPLIIVSDTSFSTLPLGLTAFQGQQGTDWNLLMAGAAISMLPGISLTLLLQRFIFKGIAISSGFGGR
jgi:multiple sugar transport system permease protein